MIEWLIESNISQDLVVIILSVLPVVELRGSLPVAINLFDIAWYWAYVLAVVGNMLPVPVLLLFFGTLAKVISRVNAGRKLVDWILQRTRRRGRMVERYGKIGLVLLVAIPLPMTGAWTGSIAAFLLGVKFNSAFISILIGVLIAGVIVTCLCLLGWTGATIAALVLGGLTVFAWWNGSGKKVVKA